ncbi:hypothetical protein F7734_54625 [Scytonema sp. UIC 10036]|uniref:5'-methylthioadenosine/S-adenosylhomocysteine nucleosidase family protein n=1 Tax=Scytonema sp. UIC 10036 TaxID=2304196 RepID=UPI0012DAD7B8|nr:hypothetical protein [Scytonema sp. UIC 10036]MUH00835.1 hypothetical protein [Scytonema sp. UIC 10036]
MPILIERLQLRKDLCEILKSDYVALLGQRGSGSRTLIHLMTTHTSPLPSMKFLAVALPQGVQDSEQFMERFLNNLIDASTQIPPQPELTDKVRQTLKQEAEFSVVFRLRSVLDVLGKNSATNYLVIVLHALADISEQPLKDLLILLREYHKQIGIPNLGGEKLRFLVVGGVRLWNLCCHKPSDFESPFNIAKRYFIGGLSYKEVQSQFNDLKIEQAIKLTDLTDGVPSLIDLISQEAEDFEDLSSCFGPLENSWNSLSDAAQAALINLAKIAQIFPGCQLDFECPQIPKFSDLTVWQEAFWGGFLRLRHRKLTWRSPIHQAFIMTQAEIQEDICKSTLLRNSLLERVTGLENAFKSLMNTKALAECIEELVSLSLHSSNVELVSLLEMMLERKPRDAILMELKNIAVKSLNPWIKDLTKLTTEPPASFNKRLIEAMMLGSTCDIRMGTKQQVFLPIFNDSIIPYNSEQELPDYQEEEQPWFIQDLPKTTAIASEESETYQEKIEVVIITATDVELKAVTRYLKPFPPRKRVLLLYSGAETYYLGKFGAFPTVVTKCRMGAIGEGSVILATEQAQRLWHPKAVIMVGIAFGKDVTKQKIADVLVASKIISYEQQSIGEEITHRGSIPPSNTILLNRFENSQNWKFLRPDGSYSQVISGSILSGEKLVDNPEFKAKLFQTFPDAIGGEMEGAGLCAASGRMGTAWILVKSICDWADGKKDDKHQALAAAAAASLVHYVLSQSTVLNGLNKIA